MKGNSVPLSVSQERPRPSLGGGGGLAGESGDFALSEKSRSRNIDSLFQRNSYSNYAKSMFRDSNMQSN